MFDQVISLENLFSAWREFRLGKRGKRDVQAFERHLEDNVFALHADLADGSYRHGPYERFHIHDPKHRVIHKASVRDRLVHHALYRVLYSVFDRSFIYDSYSCRIGKGTHKAVDRLESFVRKVSRNYRRPCHALKLDVKKFFDSVDHGILMRVIEGRLSKEIVASPSAPRNDIALMSLLQEIVESFSKRKIDEGGGSLHGAKGLPIGNLTSQLFANAYMDGFDHFVKEELRVKHYLRYADDMLFLHHDRIVLEGLLPMIEIWFWQYRKLLIHPNKISVKKLSEGIDFLGYVTLPHYRVLRTKTKRRMLKRVNVDNLASYLGLCRHADARMLERKLVIRAHS